MWVEMVSTGSPRLAAFAFRKVMVSLWSSVVMRRCRVGRPGETAFVVLIHAAQASIIAGLSRFGKHFRRRGERGRHLAGSSCGGLFVRVATTECCSRKLNRVQFESCNL